MITNNQQSLLLCKHCTDFEEPLKQFQHNKIEHVEHKEINQIISLSDSTHYDAIASMEEVKITDQKDHRELQIQSPKGASSNTSSSISVGIQCSNTKNLHDMETQTEHNTLMHSSTQTDVELLDASVQATVINRSTTTQTSQSLDNGKHLNEHQQSTSYSDKLAVAQSTIVWQSLMIKILKINATTVS